MLGGWPGQQSLVRVIVHMTSVASRSCWSGRCHSARREDILGGFQMKQSASTSAKLAPGMQVSTASDPRRLAEVVAARHAVP
mmetsp:Transcript_92817/g.236109  ORF Transcript_92817/g.236109 Transcript_92817/m.236109 type:complete len:82 (-) Transcript_92817:226-471(-)